MSNKLQQSDWEKKFDEKFENPVFINELATEAGLGDLSLRPVRDFIRQLLQQEREETLKEAIAYLKKKNPVRVPSSVMVDYTEAITDLEKLLKGKLK